jgi:hypothetical protein
MKLPPGFKATDFEDSTLEPLIELVQDPEVLFLGQPLIGEDIDGWNEEIKRYGQLVVTNTIELERKDGTTSEYPIYKSMRTSDG